MVNLSLRQSTNECAWRAGELLARVRALLRRAQPATVLPSQLRFADVAVDFKRFEARKGDTLLEMTRKEFGMLQFLAARAGEVVRRDELLDEVWDYRNYRRPAPWTTTSRRYARRSKTTRRRRNIS